MRYFFYLILLILTFLTPAPSDLKAQEITQTESSKMAQFINFAGDLSHLNSPFSKTKGIGQWVDSQYATIRLISTDSGTKNLKHTLLALEVRLNPKVKMFRPILSLKETKNVQNVRYFWPISLPLQPKEGLFYTYSATFPVEVILEKENYPLSIQIALTADFCEKECKEETILATLNIPAGHNYYSPFSAFIRHSLDFTPNLATAEQIQFASLNIDSLWLKANLPEKIQNPTFLILNEQTKKPIDFEIQKEIIENNQALFIFKINESIDDLPISIFMHAQNQMWQANGKVKKGNIPPIFSNVEAKKIPFYWWPFFILMLPSFVLFIKQTPKHELIAKKENFKNMLFVLIGTLCGALIYWIYPYSVLVNSYIWLIFCILLFAFLGYFSYPVTAFGYGILNALVPFFAFFERPEIPIPTSFNELVQFFTILSVVASMPFIIGIFKPIVNVRLGKALKGKLSPSFRFPIWLDMILFIYLTLMRLFG